MNVVIAGSRTFCHCYDRDHDPEDCPDQAKAEQAVRSYVAQLLRPGIPASFKIIGGGARGVDTWAVDQARREGGRTQVIPANWDVHGKRAGYLRNVQMVAQGDKVVVFWDGDSRGTKHTIDEAIARRRPLEVYFPVTYE